jgi:hypothetical protein
LAEPETGGRTFLWTAPLPEILSTPLGKYDRPEKAIPRVSDYLLENLDMGLTVRLDYTAARQVGFRRFEIYCSKELTSKPNLANN